jgi:glutathione S-transferase
MKLYSSIGPNPRVVRMFMAEKGMDVPLVAIDLLAGENRQDAHRARNPAGQLPCLELDDGTHLSEITAICEYLEEVQPGPALIGSTALERAETRMWTRRIDLNIVENLLNGFRFSQGLKLFQNRIHCIPQAADDLKQVAQENLRWLDGLMQGRDFVCGARLTLADILLFCFVDFAASVKQPINPELGWLVGHHARMAARPSAAA